MKMQIKEFAKLTGVSVRTLHYYDEIGLLKPSFVEEQNGYRLYDEKSLERMQEIMFYRELDFTLKSISEILSSPGYDKQQALEEQKKLLILKKNRLERLISAIEDAGKGGNVMSLSVFDNSEFEAARQQYEEETKVKWGDTPVYQEYSEKTSSYSPEKWCKVNVGMDSIMDEFAECVNNGVDPSDPSAQALVKKWQDYITENFYECTKEILSGLGKMYVADERFSENMDKHGKGTAEFMSEAIRLYCVDKA